MQSKPQNSLLICLQIVDEVTMITDYNSNDIQGFCMKCRLQWTGWGIWKIQTIRGKVK